MPTKREAWGRRRSRPSINDIATTIPNAPQPAAQSVSPDRTKLKRKTVLMNDKLSDQVKATADSNGVGINELTRYCILQTLEMIESGKHQIQGRQVTVLKLDV